MTKEIHQRKSEHITISLNEKVTGNKITSGFEKVSFLHNALPEIDFAEITIDTPFLEQHLRTPFLVSSMTGGAEMAENINRHLAIAAEERGWMLALGSTRALLESEKYHSSFQLRKYAPTIPIIANLGAVQLNYGFSTDECKKIVEITDANMLVLHLNSIQEVIQPEGNTNFKDLLSKIKKLCCELSVPVGVKEVGWGIDGEVAKKLFEAGVAFIDCAGAGGTSWSQIEKLRSTDKVRKVAAEAFSEWGIPTVDCLLSVRKHNTTKPVIASGGIHTGVDAGKAIALGANMVGIARGLLKAATESAEGVIEVMKTRELELRMAMFGIGVTSIPELQATNRIKIIEK